jgi:hypothetical protein
MVDRRCSPNVTPAAATAAQLPTHAWRATSAVPGRTDTHYYEWIRIAISEPSPGCHGLLIRRASGLLIRRASDGELAFYTIPRRHDRKD